MTGVGGADVEEKGMGFPTSEEVEKELERELEKCARIRMARNTAFFTLVVAAVAVLTVVLFLPFLQINGNSMEETLHNGEMAIAVNNSRYEKGDVIAFKYNNSVLVKRVIALPGDWVDIDQEGSVYVNDVPLEEPYVYEKGLGKCNIGLPCQVPQGEIFVLGDHRSVSIDSRNTAVGCVREEAVMGEVLFRIWPLKEIGFIE